MIKKIFLFSVLFHAFFSCTDKTEIPIPAYLYIPSISFTTTSVQGSSSHAFRDVWIYVNDTFAGAYELPIKVPVAQFGNAEIKVYADIRKDGVLSQPTRYPLTAPYIVKSNLKAGQIDTIYPVVSYYSDCIFTFLENFDQGHFFSNDIDGNPQTQITLSSRNDAFEGANSGEILLTKDNPVMIATYALSKSIPISPNKVYIELNYQCDVSFSIGFEGMKSNEVVNLINATIKPKSSWNKIYFDFTDSINQSACDNYRIAVLAVYDTTNTAAKQYIRIDNFKVIHQ
ncbi:MAG: hypothetical protein ABI851_13675 [Saprospiraceae bacterium]